MDVFYRYHCMDDTTVCPQITLVCYYEDMKKIMALFSSHATNKRTVIIAGLAAIPIIILGGMLLAWSVNAPFADQWIYADLLGKLHSGTLTFHDLWHQHNEHRIFFPKVVQLIVATITNWNVRVEVIMNFLAALGTYSLMAWLIWKSCKNWIAAAVGSVLVAWLLFSPLPYINWIWGFQLAWYVSVLALAATIWALYRNKTAAKPLSGWFWTAVVAAIVCNYSMGNGLLVWFAGAVMLSLPRPNRQQLFTWAGIGVATIGIYFYHYDFAGGGLAALLHRPIEGAQYILQYLGHPLGTGANDALLAGSIILAVGVGSAYIGWRQKILERLAPWLALATYSLLTACLAAATRFGTFGVSHSMSFSYTTISVLFTIGVAMMAVLIAEHMWRSVKKRPALWLVAGACIAGFLAYPLATSYVSNYGTGVQQMKELNTHLKKVRACLYSVQSAEDPCLLTAFPDKKAVWDKLQLLKSMHWGRF